MPLGERNYDIHQKNDKNIFLTNNKETLMPNTNKYSLSKPWHAHNDQTLTNLKLHIGV